MTVSDPRLRRRRLWLGTVLLAVVAGTAVAVFRPQAATLPAGVTPDQFRDAERQLREGFGKPPSRVAVLSLLGELAVGDERLADAAACFEQVPSGAVPFGPSARLQEGQIFVRLNRAVDAERSLREFLKLAGRDSSAPAEHRIVARNWLEYLLSVELRFEERRELLAAIHADGHADVFDSKLFYFPNLLLWHSSSASSRLEKFLHSDPDDFLLQTARGRYLTAEGRLDEAQSLLRRLRDRQPDDLTCAAALLECFYERAAWQDLATLADALPDYAPEEPWLLTRMRGELALQRRDWPLALEQFQRVLAADPANPWAHMGLAAAYSGLKQPEKRDEVLRRSTALAGIRTSLVRVNEKGPEAALELASVCDRLDFHDAAAVFRKHAERIRQSARLLRPSPGVPMSKPADHHAE